MKNNKILLIIIFLLLIVGCSKKEKQDTKTFLQNYIWKADSSDVIDMDTLSVEEENDNYTLVFFEDEKFVISSNKINFAGTYKINSDDTISLDSSTSAKCTLKNDELLCDNFAKKFKKELPEN